MPENQDIIKKQKKEQRRLTKLLRDTGTPPERIKLLEEIIQNVSFMHAKLEETREAIVGEKITVTYDNGGGQTGIRENPAFKAYEALWKTYMTGMTRIIEEMPKKEADAAVYKKGEPMTVLDMIKAKKART